MQTIEAEVVTGSIVMTCPANETDTGRPTTTPCASTR